MTRFGVVVLTRGDRPEPLAAALASVQRQQGVETDVVVVGNGWRPTGLPEGVRGHFEPENRGIPAGRNAGVPHTTGELLLFLDDDATLVEDDALAHLAETLEQPSERDQTLLRGWSRVGLAQLRVEPTVGSAYSRDWVPRLRVGDRTRSSDVTAVWEGAVAMPRALFEQIGGWPEELVYVHEGVDLAWRVLDAGCRVRYVAERSVTHPPRGPAAERQESRVRYAARNRVFLARRHLRWPLSWVYVASFMLRTLPVFRRPDLRRAALEGYRMGRREDCGTRQPLKLRTLWAMTRAGRPPVI